MKGRLSAVRRRAFSVPGSSGPEVYCGIAAGTEERAASKEQSVTVRARVLNSYRKG